MIPVYEPLLKDREKQLLAECIDSGTRPFFLGLHAQPVLRKLGILTDEPFPCADRAHKQGLYLPSGLTLTRSQIDVVREAVRDIVQEGRNGRV